MDIAKLRSRITIQRQTVTADAIGNHAVTWTDYYSCHAYANLIAATEQNIAAQTVPTETITFTLRFCSLLSALDSTHFRVLFEGRPYNILRVDDVQYRHKTLKLTATRESR